MSKTNNDKPFLKGGLLAKLVRLDSPGEVVSIGPDKDGRMLQLNLGFANLINKLRRSL